MFKIPEEKCRHKIFVAERSTDGEPSFRRVVEDAGFCGLEFIEVWDSEYGALVYQPSVAGDDRAPDHP